jgi:glycosyltransferase involved in cell wall biosynthesis
MKKVIFYMPNFHHGGAESIMVEVANYFTNNNLEVTFVVVKAEGVLMSKLNKKINIIDLNLENQWLTILKLPFVIRKINADFIFSTMKESNFIAIFSRIISLKNTKNIIREANTVSQQLENETKIHQKVKNKIILYFYKFSHKIIVLSNSMGNDLLSVSKVNKKNLIVIPNFVDIDKIKHLSSEEIDNDELFLLEKKPIFITVARLFTQKNYHFLLTALKEYINKGNHFTFIALGDGPLKKELEDYSLGLGLENNCYFLGYKSNPYKYLVKSDIFLLPSSYEGMSNSLIQAMALNLKVLVSDTQSTSLELIKEYEDGFSFKNNDIINFVEKLSNINVTVVNKSNEKLVNNNNNSLLNYLKLTNIDED